MQTFKEFITESRVKQITQPKGSSWDARASRHTEWTPYMKQPTPEHHGAAAKHHEKALKRETDLLKYNSGAMKKVSKVDLNGAPRHPAEIESDKKWHKDGVKMAKDNIKFHKERAQHHRALSGDYFGPAASFERAAHGEGTNQ